MPNRLGGRVGGLLNYRSAVRRTIEDFPHRSGPHRLVDTQACLLEVPTRSQCAALRFRHRAFRECGAKRSITGVLVFAPEKQALADQSCDIRRGRTYASMFYQTRRINVAAMRRRFRRGILTFGPASISRKYEAEVRTRPSSGEPGEGILHFYATGASAYLFNT